MKVKEKDQVSVTNMETKINLGVFSENLRSIFAGSAITAFEWYGYALYIYFSSIIGQQFFPHHDPVTSLLSMFAVFATGFAMRPLGALIFGYIGDRMGRKRALRLSLLMMIVSTTCLGFLPTYDHIGSSAGLLLLLARLIQGLAIGGNSGGAYVFSVEHASARRRGLVGSTLMCGVVFGFLLGANTTLFMNWAFSKDIMESVGWRIPFLLGGLGWFLDHYMHHHASESPVFEKTSSHTQDRTSRRAPIKILFSTYFLKFIHAIILVLPDIIGMYITFVFMNIYLERMIGASFSLAMWVNNFGLLLMLPIMIFFGWLSDRIGRKPVMIAVALSYCFFSYPLFQHLQNGGAFDYFIVQGIFSIILGAYYGALPAAIVEFFPSHIRYSGTALAFNLSAAIFGGTSSWACMWLIQKTGNLFIPAYYLALMGLVSAIALIFMPERSQGKI